MRRLGVVVKHTRLHSPRMRHAVSAAPASTSEPVGMCGSTTGSGRTHALQAAHLQCSQVAMVHVFEHAALSWHAEALNGLATAIGCATAATIAAARRRTIKRASRRVVASFKAT